MLQKDRVGIDLALCVLLFFPWIDAYAALLGPLLPVYKLFALGIGFVLLLRNYYAYSLLFTITASTFFFFHTLIFAMEVPASVKLNLDTSFRVLYPVLLVSMYQGEFLKRIDTTRYLKLFTHSVCLACLTSIFLGLVTGAGGEIAGRGSAMSGSKGFYIGANEVGIILCISVLLVYLAKLNRAAHAAYLGAIIIAGAVVFTKSSLVGSLLAIAALTIRFKLMWVINLFVFSVFTYYFYIHIDKVMFFFENTFFKDLLEEPISFVFRGRQKYIEAYFERVIFFDDFALALKQVLIGNGDYATARWIGSVLGISAEVGIRTTFEMDLFDLVSAYGFVGVLILLLVCAKFWSVMTQYQCNSVFVKICFIAIFMHSFLAGHVVFSLQVTALLAIAFILCNREIESK